MRIGTSGWNYPSGKGTWNGLFYPATGPKRDGNGIRRAALLRRTLRHGRGELQTFYGQPRADVTRGWAARTPPGLRFLAQAVPEVHAPEDVQGGGAQDGSRVEGRAARPACAGDDADDIDDFRRHRAARVARQARRAARAVSAELQGQPRSRDYLAQLLRAFADYPVAVELRHRSWSDAIGETLCLLNALRRRLGADRRAEVQLLDPPESTCRTSHGFYYMRLHGRNAAHWWHHEKSEDRYNYLYSADELRGVPDTASAAKELVKKSYLYTNNHFSPSRWSTR